MSRDFEYDSRNDDQRSVDDVRLQQQKPAPRQSAPSSHEVVAELRSVIDDAAKDRPALPVFFERLEQQGVRAIASVQASGHWNGIVYECRGDRLKGSHLGRAYTAKGLQERRGIGYDPVRDKEALARTAEVRESTVRPAGDLRNVERANRTRDIAGISPAERAVLWDVGRFRVVSAEDLQHARYDGRPSLMHQDMKHLVAEGYLERRRVPVDGHGRTMEVLALTRAGRALLRRDAGNQALYDGLVKPREIVHDAALYRMFQKEAARIERDGGKVRRVVLDYELKKRAYRPLAQAQNLPPLEYAERQQEIAQENDLPVVDGHIVLPDLRVEYETRDGEERHVDLELATRNYRAAHIQAKAAAGFRVYADTSSHGLAAALDNHDVIAEVLRM
jgi:DNA-binding MarR family transcriptional regulator